MLKIIIGVVIVVLIIIAIAYSDYIAWFFRLFKYRIHHDSQINKLVNENKIRRLVSNKSIRELVKKVDEKIKLLKHPVNPKPYALSDALERKDAFWQNLCRLSVG